MNVRLIEFPDFGVFLGADEDGDGACSSPASLEELPFWLWLALLVTVVLATVLSVLFVVLVMTSRSLQVLVLGSEINGMQHLRQKMQTLNEQSQQKLNYLQAQTEARFASQGTASPVQWQPAAAHL